MLLNTAGPGAGAGKTSAMFACRLHLDGEASQRDGTSSTRWLPAQPAARPCRQVAHSSAAVCRTHALEWNTPSAPKAEALEIEHNGTLVALHLGKPARPGAPGHRKPLQRSLRSDPDLDCAQAPEQIWTYSV
jgi:hypothetical protein